ncbi:hypothetical protein B0T24DRAFT_218214 [Lasiosphaeria ovina]|uniref:Mid2 domain-containing protein n=1 Tax=Lasiosphaeria ovina TaxID=92902 RepID=A0AAE0KGJ3_9PEZI|nr:hypothetical protein B0T24DRAFT_218214 [Lasiosphaeria ovina]
MLDRLFLLAVLLAQTTAFAMFEGRDSHKTTTNILHNRGVIDAKFATIYYSGDSANAREPATGYDCRVDGLNNLWGFCPKTVIAATDCGLAGRCVDDHSCTSGCGFTESTLMTITCSESQFPFCSTVLLSLSDDVRTFSYIACGRGPSTDLYFAFTTDPPPKPTTPPPPSSPAPSPSPPTVSPTPRTRSASARSTPSKTSSLATPSSTTAYPTSATTSTTNSDPLSSSVSGSNNIGNTNDTSNATGANNLGPIVGAVVGSVALICVSLIVVLWLLRKRRVRELSPGPGTSGKDSVEADRDSATSQPQTLQTQPPSYKKHHWSGGWGPGELPGHVDYVSGRLQELPGSTRTPPEPPNNARMLPELASNPKMPPELSNSPRMPPQLPNNTRIPPELPNNTHLVYPVELPATPFWERRRTRAGF